ncbi:MAG: hypothetical protein QM831_01600 [Kofleriaceae bacterium]
MRLQRHLLTLAIALVGALVFVTAVTGGWVYDDKALIAHDVHIHSFADWPRWFITDFWNVDDELVQFGARILYWRPLVVASYALDWKIGGGSPVYFHVVNLAMQAVASALAFTTLRRWLGGAVWPAAAAALLFAVHPTKAESVAWISGRTDIICLIAILVAAAGIARRREGKHGGIALEMVGTIVAYLSKEQAIVLPCFAAVEAWVASGRPAIDKAAVKTIIRGALPQAVLAIVYLAIRTLVLPIGAANGAQHVPLFHHALALFETLGRFVTLTAVPHDLSIQQGLVHTIQHEAVHSYPYVAIGVVSTIVLVVLAWRLRTTMPAVTIGIALYFVTIAPTSNLIYTGMATLVSERFLYLPLFGFAYAFGAVLERYGIKRWVAGATLVIALALSIQSLRRSSDFIDDATLWKRELAMHPDSLTARYAAVSRAIEDKQFYTALGLLQNTSPYDETFFEYVATAFQVAGTLTRLIPDHDPQHLLQIDKFCADLIAKRPAAIDVMGVKFSLDLSNLENDRDLHDSIPRFLEIRADLQSRLGHDAAAVELAQQAIDLCPRCGSIVTMYALVLARAQHYDDALAVLDQAEGHIPGEGLAETREHVTAARQLAIAGQNLQGPAALQNHATELAKLELWGRAFDVLAPYEADISHAPKFAVGFAELAFRAGEEATARRVLAVSKSPAEIDALIAEWTQKMGWTR